MQLPILRAAEELQAQEEPAVETRAVTLAAHLAEWRSKAHNRDALVSLGKSIGLSSVQHLQDLLRATAYRCCMVQSSILRKILAYVRSQVLSKMVKPLCFLHALQYDETPLRLKVTKGADELIGVQTEVLQSKMFAVQSHWSMLLAEGPDSKPLVIAGSWAPELRVATSTSGECVARVLSSCSRPVREIPGGLPALCAAMRK